MDTSVTHKVYGVPQTINTANYVYFLAYRELFALRPRQQIDAIPVLSENFIPFRNHSDADCVEPAAKRQKLSNPDTDGSVHAIHSVFLDILKFSLSGCNGHTPSTNGKSTRLYNPTELDFIVTSEHHRRVHHAT